MQILEDGSRMSTVTETQILGFFGKYKFLSNFEPSKIKIEGIEYPTVEHAYMAYKTLDINERINIAALETPGKARRYGTTKIILRSDWELIKFGIMLNCLYHKFAIPELKEKLLATGDKYLEETNNWNDCIWGVSSTTNVGHNLLGRALMLVRDKYKK